MKTFINFSIKYCECGCGTLLPPAKKTSRRDGWIKGQPKRFIHGHQMRGARNNWYGKHGAMFGKKGKEHPMFGRKHSKDIKKKISLASKKLWKNKSHRKHIQEIMTEKWKNKEYKEKILSKMLKKFSERPTSLEKKMLEIIQKHNLPYKYVGDGKFWIDGKNPDFVNTNGEKKLIEVGNVFHHQGDYIQKRREHFAKYGWQSYIFIGDTLNEKEVLREVV